MLSPTVLCSFLPLLLSEANPQLIGNESNISQSNKTFFSSENPVESIEVTIDLLRNINGSVQATERDLRVPIPLAGINCYACTFNTCSELVNSNKIGVDCRICYPRQMKAYGTNATTKRLCSKKKCVSYEQMWNDDEKRDICCTEAGCREASRMRGQNISSTKPDHESSSSTSTAAETNQDSKTATHVQSTIDASTQNNTTLASTFGCYHCTPCTQSNLESELRIGGCQHCIYRETLQSGNVTQISRVCTGENDCVSSNRLSDGSGERQICCKGENCNRNWDTAKRLQSSKLI